MTTSRRNFLKTTSLVAIGFSGLRSFLHPTQVHADSESGSDLSPDPKHLLDLPDGFTYRVISEAGQTMSDGLLVPGEPDGMGAFVGPDGVTILIRNHEMTPDAKWTPYGARLEHFSKVPVQKLYDPGQSRTPSIGGTTTIVYDTKKQEVVREFLSLGGTVRNCAGGVTPWNSWISCEETVLRKDSVHEYALERDHGYNFEVPASAEIQLADPVPLREMGRFNHEAIAVDPVSGAVYQTEDRDDGLFYRFVPNVPGKLAEGGRLQALVLRDKPSTDTRNWWGSTSCVPGETYVVDWMDMENVESPHDDLRMRGFESGAARFARGEGIWYGDGQVFFACTSGGSAMAGQIWRYRPSPVESQAAESDQPGTLELFIEPNDSELLMSADNLTIAPSGDLFVCEDRSGPVIRIVRVTPEGKLSTFANCHAGSELAGAVFSPDGSTLFVNIQHVHKTLAITGDWSSLATG